MENPNEPVVQENPERKTNLKRAAADLLNEIVDHIYLFHEHEKEWKDVTASTQRLFSDFKAHVINRRQGKSSVYQIEVVKQRDPVSCGFHALHNACHALSGNFTTDPLMFSGL